MKTYIGVVICAIVVVLGQVLWKISTQGLDVELSSFAKVSYLMRNKLFIIGCVLYIFATFLWVLILAKEDFSVIYPLYISLCVIASVGIGYFVFNETGHILSKIVGISLISLGIFFLV